MAVNSNKQGSYHHGDLRRALINVAVQVVAEQGVDSLTLREVAQRVGVSRMAPYRHFENKSALLAAVAQEGFQSLHTHLNNALAQAPLDPLKRLQAIGVAYVLYAVAHSTHYRVMFGPCISNRATYPELDKAAASSFKVLVQTLIECQQAKCVRSGSPEELAQVLWSLVHGLSMLIIDGQFSTVDCAVEKLAHSATWTTIEGLLY